MPEYPAVRNILSFLFSVETGLSMESANEGYLDEARSCPDLIREVETIFNDDAVDWISLLENDRYCAYSTESPQKAREYAKNILLNPLIDNGLLNSIK